jgi:hypothetical protein
MRYLHKTNGLIMLSILVFSIFISPKFASAADAIGQVKTLTGQATVSREGTVTDLNIGSKLFQQDVITTKVKARLGLTFLDNSMFSMGPESELSLASFTFDTTTYKGAFETNMKRGTLAAVSGKIAKYNPGAMTLKTPSAILGVRGTRFLVKVEGN